MLAAVEKRVKRLEAEFANTSKEIEALRVRIQRVSLRAERDTYTESKCIVLSEGVKAMTRSLFNSSVDKYQYLDLLSPGYLLIELIPTSLRKKTIVAKFVKKCEKGLDSAHKGLNPDLESEALYVISELKQAVKDSSIESDCQYLSLLQSFWICLAKALPLLRERLMLARRFECSMLAKEIAGAIPDVMSEQRLDSQSLLPDLKEGDYYEPYPVSTYVPECLNETIAYTYSRVGAKEFLSFHWGVKFKRPSVLPFMTSEPEKPWYGAPLKSGHVLGVAFAKLPSKDVRMTFVRVSIQDKGGQRINRISVYGALPNGVLSCPDLCDRIAAERITGEDVPKLVNISKGHALAELGRISF